MAMIVPGFNDHYTYGGELYHHGIKGQKHGVRRYQNEDGTLTMLGRRHYDIGMGRIPSNPAQAAARVKSTAARTDYNSKNSKYTPQSFSSIRDRYAQNQYNNSWQGKVNNFSRSAQRGMSAGVNRVGQMLGSAATIARNTPEYVTGANARRRMKAAADTSYNGPTYTDIARAANNVRGSGDYDQFTNNMVNKARSEGKHRTEETIAARQAYNKTLPGQAERLGREARENVSAAKKRVADAATNVWNTASGAVTSAAGEAKKRLAAAGEYVTGNKARKELERAQNLPTGERLRAKEAEWVNNGYYDKDRNEPQKFADNAYVLDRRRDEKVKKAQSEYDKTLPGQLQTLGNNVGNAVTGAAGNVRDAAKGAYDYVSSGQAGRDATNALNTASGAVGSAAKEAKRRVGEAAGNVRDRATDVWNTASGAVTSAAGEAKRRVGEAAGNVRDAAKGAYDYVSSGQAGKDAANTARNVGSAVGNAAKGAYEYVTGNKARKELERAQNLPTGERLRAKEAEWVNNGYYDKDRNEPQKFADNAYVLDRRRDEKVKKAQSEYDKTLPGQLQTLGNNVSNAATTVRDAAVDGWHGASKFVSDRASDISTFASTMADNAGTAIKNLPQTAGNLIDSGKTMVGDAISGVGSAAKAAGDFMGERVSDVTGAVGGAFSKGASFVGGAFKRIKWW